VILSPGKARREASGDELFGKAEDFLKQMVKLGVTTVECKSGYGLSIEDELKTLHVYRRLSEEQPLNIVATFLGAHTIPSEYEDDHSSYIDLVINEMIQQIAGEDH